MIQRRGSQKRKNESLKPHDVLDRIIWEIVPKEDIPDEDQQIYLCKMREYLLTRGALENRIEGKDYFITASHSKAMKTLRTHITRAKVSMKRFVLPIDSELIWERVIATNNSYLLDDILWNRFFDQKVAKPYGFIYVIHDGTEVFYVGQSLLPGERFLMRFANGRNLFRLDDNPFLNFLFHHQFTSRYWRMSILTLPECQSLVVNTVVPLV